MNLHEFIERANRRIGKAFDQTGAILPMYHIIAGDGSDYIMPAPFVGDKDVSVFIVRGILKALEATRYVFIGEAWTLAAADVGKIDIENVRREGVVNQPGRREVVMFSGEDQGEGILTAHREIIREGNRKPYLGPIEFWQPGRSEGRVIGLLPRGKLAS